MQKSYAISAERISISQSNIVLIVTAVINLSCFGEPTLPLPEASHPAEVHLGLLVFEVKFFSASGWFTGTGSGTKSSHFSCVTLNIMF